MGNTQQIEWVESLRGRVRGPILEIGSKRHGPPPRFFDYRTLFPGVPYTGLDLEPGLGVDVTIDMTRDFADIDAAVGGQRFDALICMSAMEHVRDVFRFAQNTDRLLAPGAVVMISVPFAWGVHAYPSDYWRFTPAAIEFLYPSIAFDDRLSRLHTAGGVVAALTEARGNYQKFTHAQPSLATRIARRLGLATEPLLHFTMFDMFGVKELSRAAAGAGSSAAAAP